MFDFNAMSFVETAEDRECGTFLVVIKSIRSNGQPERLAITIATKKAINQSEADELVERLSRGEAISCRFSDLLKARLFVLACEMCGALCDFDE